MRTYYGKPTQYGSYTLVTAWESAGVLFHNARVLIKRGEEVLSVRPFSEFRQARDEVTTMMFDEAKERRLKPQFDNGGGI